MKKLISLFSLLLLAPVTAWAQTASTYYTVPTVAALKALTTRPSVVQIVDANPGVFNWSTTTCSAPDNIYQITPTAGPTGCYTRMATPYSIGKNPILSGTVTGPDGTTWTSAGFLLGVNGSVGTPVLGRGTSGLYFSGASGSLFASIAGTQMFRLDASQNMIQGAAPSVTGTNNVVCGGTATGSSPSGGALTTGSANFLCGSRAGSSLTDWNSVVAIGTDAGKGTTTSAGRINPAPSVYIGNTAGKNTVEGGNTGVGNTAAGGSALVGGCNAYSETAFGNGALAMVCGSQKDTAIGDNALGIYQRGGQMLAMGRSPFQWLTEGSYGIAAGHAAAFFSVWDSGGIYIGSGAGSTTVGNPPRITASVDGAGVMTVTVKNGSDANLAIGQTCVSTTSTPLASNYLIQSLGSGTGGTGTYNVLPATATASQTMQCGAAMTNVIVIGNSSNPFGQHDQNVVLLGDNVQPAISADNYGVIGHGFTSLTTSGYLVHGIADASVTGATQTYTGAQMVGGVITRSGVGTTTDTTATAAQLVAAVPGAEVGTGMWLDIVNNNTGTLTITAASGVTLSGNSTVTASGRNRYLIRFTNVGSGTEAATMEAWIPTNMSIPGTFQMASGGNGVNVSAPNDGQLRLTSAASATTGALIDVSTTATFKFRDRTNAADAAITAGAATFSGAAVIMSALGSDATHTDNTVCVDSSNGTLYKGSGTLGVCLGTSSARYKTDFGIEPFGLSEIMALKPVSYRYRLGFGDSGARRQLGFTAEQMHAVMPSLVDLDTSGRPNSIDWPALIPVIVKAIQQQQQRIIALEDR